MNTGTGSSSSTSISSPLPRPYATAPRFTLIVPGVHTAIVGTSKPARIASNAEIASSQPLKPAEFEAIRVRWNAIAKPSWLGQE